MKSSRFRHATWVSCSLAVVVSLGVAACADDGGVTACAPNTPTSDSGTGNHAATPPRDAAVADAVSDADAAAPDAADAAGPVLTTSLESSGSIQTLDQALLAGFYQDDTVLRLSSAPECVAFVRSANKPLSSAGQLTLSSANFGKDGGPPGTEMVLEPNADVGNRYIFPFPPATPSTFYPATGSVSIAVQVKTAGESGVPAMPLQNMKSPSVDNVHVTAPARPDGGAVVASSTQDLTVTWATPDAGAAGEKMIIAITGLSDPATREAELHCVFPLAAGRAVLPKELLTELRKRVPVVTGAPFANLHIVAGDGKNLQVAGGTFAIEISRGATTDLEDIELDLR